MLVCLHVTGQGIKAGSLEQWGFAKQGEVCEERWLREPEDLVPKKMHQSKRFVSVNVYSDPNILISKSFVIPPGSVVTTFQSLGT